MRHYPGNLMQMVQIMRRPGGQQFPQRDRSECRMQSAPRQVLPCKMQRAQVVQVLPAYSRKLIQQLPQRFARALMNMAEAIKGAERLSFAEFKNRPRPRHPICAVGVNQVDDDIKRAPGIFALIAMRPLLRQIAQQRVQSRRRARQ